MTECDEPQPARRPDNMYELMHMLLVRNVKFRVYLAENAFGQLEPNHFPTDLYSKKMVKENAEVTNLLFGQNHMIVAMTLDVRIHERMKSRH